MEAPSIIFNFRDAKGKTSSTRIHVESGLSFALLVEFAEAAAEIIKNITTAELTSVNISVPLDISAATLRAAAETFADVVNKGLFSLYALGQDLFSRISLPTWDEANNHADSDAINLADTQVATLATVLDTGVTFSSLTTRVLNRYDNQISDVTSGREIFRKS